jgi:hypothetical protein
MYADYNFYTTEYKGSLIPDTAFAEQAREASAYLDYITHNRIPAINLPGSVMVKVKMAMCAVADICYKQMTDEKPAVSSEAVGNHSISYAVAAKSFAERQHEKLTKAKMYLHGTGLLYGGLK